MTVVNSGITQSLADAKRRANMYQDRETWENNQPCLKTTTPKKCRQVKGLFLVVPPEACWLDRLVAYGDDPNHSAFIGHALTCFMYGYVLFSFVKRNLASILMSCFIFWWALYHRYEHSLETTIFLAGLAMLFLMPMLYSFVTFAWQLMCMTRDTLSQEKFNEHFEQTYRVSSYFQALSIALFAIMAMGAMLSLLLFRFPT